MELKLIICANMLTKEWQLLPFLVWL
jgi:hypothetical protein